MIVNKTQNILLKEKKRFAKDKDTLFYKTTFAALRFFDKRFSSKKAAKVIKNMKCFKCEKRYKD